MTKTHDLAPRADYLEKINQAIADSAELRECLKALRSAPESLGYWAEIDSFVKLIDGNKDASEIVDDGQMAMWLPVIIEFRECKADKGTKIAILAAAITRCADIRVAQSQTWKYLVVLSLTLLVIFITLCAYIIPEFDRLYSELRLRLPPLTRTVLWVSSIVGPNSKAILMIIVGTILMLMIGKRLRKRLGQQHLKIRNWWLFSAGSNSRVIAMSRLLYTLSCLVKLNVPIQDSLVISGRASQSELYVQYAVRLAREWTLSNVIPRAREFPRLMIQSLEIARQSEKGREIAAEFLRELSIIYSDRVRNRREFISQFLFPFALIAIGFCVGIIVIALALPLIKLVSVLL